MTQPKALTIDRYRIERLLGQGGVGRVYLATDPKLNREVAIKVLAAKVDERTRERFQLEARAIAALKHPNIVELYDYSGAGATDLFLVLEYVPGKNLYEHLLERGPMREKVALCIGHELALALNHAYRFKVVHRDIKPENVLLHRGRMVLADFGVIKVLEASDLLGVDDVESHTQSIGTPGFMAPEQLEGHNLDHRVDIFAAGAVLYNLATGHLPYEGSTTTGKYGRGEFVDPRAYVPELSDHFAHLLKKCVAAKPKDRFDDPNALRAAILEGLAQQGVTEVRQELEVYEVNGVTERTPPALPAFTMTTTSPRSQFVRLAGFLLAGCVLGFAIAVAAHASGMMPVQIEHFADEVFGH